MRNKGRLINWQKTREINAKRKFEGRSPYWEHMERIGKRDEIGSIIEYPIANPDTLSDEGEEGENLTRKTMMEIIKAAKFSRKERAVLNLVALRGKTEEEAAALLGLSRSSVQVYIRRAQKKCHKAFVIKMRNSGVYSEQGQKP